VTAHLNAEVDSLIAFGAKFQPIEMVHPGGGPSYGGLNLASRSVLRSGYWSEPFIKQSEAGTKALTSGTVVVPALMPGYVPIPDRPILITQVIPRTTITAGTNLYAYLQGTVRTHAAAEVASGSLKPVGTYTIQMVTGAVRMIATVASPSTVSVWKTLTS
jgi:hypothetical protein